MVRAARGDALRDAGAVISPDRNDELATWMAGPPTPMPSGYNPVSGFGIILMTRGAPRAMGCSTAARSCRRADRARRRHCRNPGRRTLETSGSLLNPASMNMLVSIKPTVGRISRHGIIPLTADRTPPARWRTVADAATLFGALEDAQVIRRIRSNPARRRQTGTTHPFSPNALGARASASRARSITSPSRRPACRACAAGCLSSRPR
jgi:hypothetical protein